MKIIFKQQFFLIILLFVLLFINCPVLKHPKDEVNIIKKITPIDIRTPNFLWLIQPWKDGKLATIDGWGRFAEISFIGANRIKIKHLTNFPRTALDRNLITWPQADLMASTSGKMHHLAAIGINKTKSHVPLLSWVHWGINPVLLDSVEGLIGYSYILDRNDNDINTRFFIYNYREDTMVYESLENEFTIVPIIAINDHIVLSWERRLNGNRVEDKNILYDWRKNEIIENDFTNELNTQRIDLMIGHLFNVNLEKKQIFGYSRLHDDRFKITWNEGFSDIRVTPLSYLLPNTGMNFSNFIFSADGMWVSTFVTGYRGLNNENLSKRAFFHLDNRYPNGISIPVITEDYEERQWDYSAFVEHPVHGLCFAQEWHKNGRQYLRLYKMNDVLTEINRRLLNTAERIIP